MVDGPASRNPEVTNEGTGSSYDPLPVSLLEDATLPVATAPPNDVRALECSPLKQIDSRNSENNPEAADEMELVIPAAEAASDNGAGVGAAPVPPPLREQVADAEAIEQRSVPFGGAVAAAARSRLMALAEASSELPPEGPSLWDQMARREVIERLRIWRLRRRATLLAPTARPNAVPVSAPEVSDEPRVERKGKPHQLYFRQDKAGRGKYKSVELVLPVGHKTRPVGGGPTAPYHTVNVGLEIEAPDDSEFLLPTFISPGQRKLLRSTLCFVLCFGAFAGIVFLLIVQGLSGSGGDDALAEGKNLTLPTNTSDNCTLTYDPDDISELMRKAYVRTFFNVTCLATNGTGDPCDLHLAEEYTYRMFSALRFDRLVAEFLALVAIFSLAQIGGIPRPTDWIGMFFWLAWMATMLAQYVVILCALILQVFSFLGVRARLSPCLVRVDGTALLDFYAMCTFAVQPALVIKATMLFVYSFLLSLGMLVFDGSRRWPWHGKPRLSSHAVLPRARAMAFVTRLRSRARSRGDGVASGSANQTQEEDDSANTDDAVIATEATVATRVSEDNFIVAASAAGSTVAASPCSAEATAANPAAVAEPADAAAGIVARLIAQTNRLVRKLQQGAIAQAVRLEKNLAARYPRVARFLKSPAIPKLEFVKDASGPIKPKRKQFKARLSLSLCHYNVARTIVLGASFSIWAALGNIAAAPGVVSAWVLALFVAAVLTPMVSWAMGTRRWNQIKETATDKVSVCGRQALQNLLPYVLSLIIFCPFLSASAILPLSALFMLVVQFAYFLGRFLLAHIGPGAAADGDTQVWIGLPLPKCGCCTWADAFAGPTRTCLSWIQSTSIFSHVDGVLGRSQGEALTFYSKSYATLAGGLSCFWVLLALAPVASHIAWARARSLISSEGVAAFANDTSLAVGDADGLTGEWSWVWVSLMVWLWLGAAIVLCCCSAGNLLAGRAVEMSFQWRELASSVLLLLLDVSLRTRRLLKTAFACSLFALTIFIFTAAQTADAKELIATTYASSSVALSGLQLDWNGALPSFDELVKVLKNPGGALSSVVQRMVNLLSYAKFDPAYFSEGVQALTAINLVLSFAKLLATYGRKLFALRDAVKKFLKTHGREAGSEGDDGTVQVYETMTDLAAIAILGLLNKQEVKDSYRWKIGGEVSFAKLVLQEELNFDYCHLGDGDMAGLVALVTHPEMAVKLRSLSLKVNEWVTAEAWEKALTDILTKGSLTIISSLNLASCGIGIKGAKVVAKALRVNGSLTSLDLFYNGIGKEGGVAIAEALKVNVSLTSLNLERNGIGEEGGKVIAEALRVNGSLTSLDVSNNDIGKEAAIELVSIFKEKQMTSVGLEGCDLGSDGAKIVADYIRDSGSLTNLNLSSNNLAGERESGFNIKATEVQGSSFNIGDQVTYQGREMTISMVKDSNGYIKMSDLSGIKELASAIAVSSSLTSLNLYGNKIGPEGGKAVAEALSVNGSLTNLELRGCGIGPEGGVAIANALKVNGSLTNLDLSNNGLDNTTKTSLKEAASAKTGFTLELIV